MSGASRASTVSGVGASVGRARRRGLRGRADDAGRGLATPRGPPRSDGRAVARSSVRPPGPNTCKIDVVRAGHRWRRSTGLAVIGGEIRRGKSRQREMPTTGLPVARPMPARGGDADPQAGEAAGSRRHHDAVEIGERSTPDRCITRAISGISASAWPRVIGDAFARDDAATGRCRTRRPSRPRAPYRWRASAWRNRTADSARRTGVTIGKTLRRPSQLQRQDPTPASLHRPDFGDVGHEMAQQILDAVAQRRRR